MAVFSPTGIELSFILSVSLNSMSNGRGNATQNLSITIMEGTRKSKEVMEKVQRHLDYRHALVLMYTLLNF
jgi:hypothetical protein